MRPAGPGQTFQTHRRPAQGLHPEHPSANEADSNSPCPQTGDHLQRPSSRRKGGGPLRARFSNPGF